MGKKIVAKNQDLTVDSIAPHSIGWVGGVPGAWMPEQTVDGIRHNRGADGFATVQAEYEGRKEGE